MAVLELSKEQIFDLVQQMTAKEKREMLHFLAQSSPAQRSRRQFVAEEQLRQLCSARGLNWDGMTEEERDAIIDDLVHEDRPCGS